MPRHSLLATKLYIPPVRPELVSRPRLIERLNEGLRRQDGGLTRKLTLISAPAGFGKTTLAAEWAAHFRLPIADSGLGSPEGRPIESRKSKIENRVAWLSLDEGDDDPARFLAYLVAALRTVEAGFGRGALGALYSPQPPPAEAVLTLLINETLDLPGRTILVLDDYHLIEAQPVHDALAFLLEHLPPQMHLVVASREDPPLSLARLRVRGQLTELRASDLRFTSAEAAEFLNRVMGLDLSAEDIAALERRTEGWIAGLHLAAISMQRHQDASGFVRSFTGSHRFVLDYLVEEVLDQQPPARQAFLLKTSILERLSGPLCDVVVGGQQFPGSQTVLEHLEAANLFIVPLDDERRWYRYHHLFADLLRQRLRQTRPEWVPTLHQRASEWYEQNGFTDEAIEHALRAGNSERAADLIEKSIEALWGQGEHNKLQRWLGGLPSETLSSKPQLCIFQARILCNHGQLDAAEQSLQAAEQALGICADPPTGTWPIEQDRSPGPDGEKQQGRIAVTRALLAFFQGDVPGIIQYSRQALECLPEQDLAWRSSAAIALADAYRIQGDITAAHQARLQALEISKRAGNVYMILIASMKLAVTMRQQGRLEQAKEICEQQLQLADESGLSQTAVAGGFLAIWGEMLAEFDDLDGALDRSKRGVELAECGEDMIVLGWSYLCLMRVLVTRGDMAGAERLVQKIKKNPHKLDIPSWITKMMAAWQARVWLAQNNLEAASRWMAERGLDVDRELEFLREFEHMVLARILVAQGRLDEAASLLQRLLGAAETGERISSVIEILILQALALQAQEDTTQAVATLEKALIRAEPGGFVRTFVDEGPSMAHLLTEAVARGIAPDYARRLLAAFGGATKDERRATGLFSSSSVFSPSPALVEPLSERELEVLQLIAEGLTNREIAGRLYLSLNTVKAHTRNIYGKLGVHSRTQAIARARGLGLLPGQRV